MEIKGKVHCFFEQSGTFKNEFIKLGIPAEDYDIQNNFGQTDHQIDLFAEIEKGWDGRESVFDGITPDDLVLAFFPCIAFCNVAEYNQRSIQEKWRREKVPIKRIWELLKKKADLRYKLYTLCLKMHATLELRNCRLIMENPWHELNYTNHFWFMRPTLIDKDRTRRGDFFKKPTVYFFTNCQPTTRYETISPVDKANRRFICIGGGGKERRTSQSGRLRKTLARLASAPRSVP